jgi:hypothetical protein
VVLLGGLGLQVIQILGTALRDVRPTPAASAAWFLRALAVAVAVMVAGFLFRRLRLRTTLAIVFACHFAAGAWVIARVPRPGIDVFMMQQLGSQDILKGENPYTSLYPNIYAAHLNFYPPGMAEGNRLTVGFGYPPLSLLMAAPGYLVAGDVRYMHLLAMIAAAAAMALARPGLLAALAGALFLFTPRTFFVLRESWTDPFVVVLLAATVLAACRRPALTPVAFGLLLAVKPYTVLFVPLLFLLVPGWRVALRTLALAGVVAAAVTVPMAFWSWGPFYESVLGVQFKIPPRLDSLSFWTAWVRAGGPFPPTWLGFAAAAVLGGLAAWRAPRTPAGFAGAVALTTLVFFAVGVRAFCNYYYFVIGALCCAIACHGEEPQLKAGDEAI